MYEGLLLNANTSCVEFPYTELDKESLCIRGSTSEC